MCDSVRFVSAVRVFLQGLLWIVIEYLEPSLTFMTFLRNAPFVIIDCSRQNKLVKSGTVDVRLDFECKENVPQIQQPIVSSYTWFSIIH